MPSKVGKKQQPKRAAPKRRPANKKRQVRGPRRQRRAPLVPGMLDARHGMHIARPIHRATCYSVIRDKQVINLNVGTLAGVFVAAPVGGFGSTYITDIIAVSAGGASTLASGAVHRSTNFNGGIECRARLHNMTMQVAVTSPPTGSLLPTGVITCGALKSNIEAANANTGVQWNTFMTNRGELHNPTAYELMMRPRVFHSRPMDLISYDEFLPAIAGTTISGNLFSDSLTPLVVSWPANAVTGQVITITLWTEWAVIYTADPVLQSTSSVHLSLPDSSWFGAMEAAVSATGVAGALRALGGGQGLARGAARALPAIMM